jgi:hypothetical protein
VTGSQVKAVLGPEGAPFLRVETVLAKLRSAGHSPFLQRRDLNFVDYDVCRHEKGLPPVELYGKSSCCPDHSNSQGQLLISIAIRKRGCGSSMRGFQRMLALSPARLALRICRAMVGTIRALCSLFSVLNCRRTNFRTKRRTNSTELRSVSCLSKSRRSSVSRTLRPPQHGSTNYTRAKPPRETNPCQPLVHSFPCLLEVIPHLLTSIMSGSDSQSRLGR